MLVLLCCTLSLRVELQTLDWRPLNTLWGEKREDAREGLEAKGWNDKMEADVPFANTRRRRYLMAIY